MASIGSVLKLALLFLMITIVVGLLVSLPVMLLWNSCLVPAVTGLNEISWLQAWGIVILFSILFKTTVSSEKND